MTQCLESIVLSLTFWAFTQFRSFFFGLSLKFVDFFGHSTKRLDSNPLMTQAVSRRLESIQLMTKVDSPGIYSDWLMTQSVFQFYDPTQLMTRAKSIWFWIGSWFDSESYPSLISSSNTNCKGKCYGYNRLIHARKCSVSTQTRSTYSCLLWKVTTGARLQLLASPKSSRIVNNFFPSALTQ